MSGRGVILEIKKPSTADFYPSSTAGFVETAALSRPAKPRALQQQAHRQTRVDSGGWQVPPPDIYSSSAVSAPPAPALVRPARPPVVETPALSRPVNPPALQQQQAHRRTQQLDPAGWQVPPPDIYSSSAVSAPPAPALVRPAPAATPSSASSQQQVGNSRELMKDEYQDFAGDQFVILGSQYSPLEPEELMYFDDRDLSYYIKPLRLENGIHNCGNSCYLNSMIHYLRACILYSAMSSTGLEKDPRINFTPSVEYMEGGKKLTRELTLNGRMAGAGDGQAVFDVLKQYFTPRTIRDYFDRILVGPEQDSSIPKMLLDDFMNMTIESNKNENTVTIRPRGGLKSEQYGRGIQSDPNDAIKHFVSNLKGLGFNFLRTLSGTMYKEKIIQVDVNYPRDQSAFACQTHGKIKHETRNPVLKGDFNMEELVTHLNQIQNEARSSVDSGKQKYQNYLTIPLDSNMRPSFIHLGIEQKGYTDGGGIQMKRNIYPLYIDKPVEVGMSNYIAHEMICHRGDVDGGHYISCGRRIDPSDNKEKWYLFDDAPQNIINFESGDALVNHLRETKFAPVCIMLQIHTDYYDEDNSVDLEPNTAATMYASSAAASDRRLGAHAPLQAASAASAASSHEPFLSRGERSLGRERSVEEPASWSRGKSAASYREVPSPEGANESKPMKIGTYTPKRDQVGKQVVILEEDDETYTVQIIQPEGARDPPIKVKRGLVSFAFFGRTRDSKRESDFVRNYCNRKKCSKEYAMKKYRAAMKRFL